MSTGTLRSRRRMRRARGIRRGFTIVELLLAIMLLSVGMLASAGILVSSTRLQRMAGSRAELTALGEAKLEELRSYGQTIPADPLRARLAIGGSTTVTTNAYADSLTSLNGVTYLRRWQISAGIAGARQVQLRVQPKSRPRYHLPSLDFTSTILLQ
jgi:prepilin-type N-terminal cleavage/methylation domain-containing protein